MKIDLFFIKEIKEFRIYELNLLKEIRIFLIFDILLLESTNFNIFIQKTFYFESDDNQLYIVKIFLNRKHQQYLIK